jgi:hypothetical protein
MNVLCQGPEMQPGQCAELLVIFAAGRRLTNVWMDPPTAASFYLERVAHVMPAEMHVMCGLLAPGAVLVVRHKGSAPARFRADCEAGPELERVERQIVTVIERDWKAAYDQAKAAAR